MDGTAVLMRLDQLLSAIGLTRRGAFVPDAGDDVPDLADGRRPAASTPPAADNINQTNQPEGWSTSL